ncbi:MAG: hypothetical protein Q8P41_12145 [Pseudomonadota bacterium]|nr:hypothetical protein [Pseudomonadota bacterium]
MLFALLLSACQPDFLRSSEVDRPRAGSAAWVVDGHALRLEEHILTADGVPLLEHVYDEPVVGDHVLYVPADPGPGDGGIYAVRIVDGAVRAVPILEEGRPDRLALAPDGTTLAYVAGTSGIASVWVVPVAGGRPRQLTNVNLASTPGRAPADFVHPPDDGPVQFVGSRVVWVARGAEREATWR